MNDPHVVRLHYRVRPGDDIQFHLPISEVWETPEGSLVITDNAATMELKNHYADSDEARTAVIPFLEAWEIWAGLTAKYHRRPFRFEFKRADIVDRKPPPDQDVAVRMTASSDLRADGIVVEGMRCYPAPPDPMGFVVDATVAKMWSRWESYRAGREPLPQMAYYVLTALEDSVQGADRRRRAATGLAIDPRVLSELGRLSSEVGAEDEARKARRTHPRPYTDDERAWIEEVVRSIIKRVGEKVANPNTRFTTIDMASLPQM